MSPNPQPRWGSSLPGASVSPSKESSDERGMSPSGEAPVNRRATVRARISWLAPQNTAIVLLFNTKRNLPSAAAADELAPEPSLVPGETAATSLRITSGFDRASRTAAVTSSWLTPGPRPASTSAPGRRPAHPPLCRLVEVDPPAEEEAALSLLYRHGRHGCDVKTSSMQRLTCCSCAVLRSTGNQDALGCWPRL